jgi:hypothetical protein
MFTLLVQEFGFSDDVISAIDAVDYTLGQSSKASIAPAGVRAHAARVRRLAARAPRARITAVLRGTGGRLFRGLFAFFASRFFVNWYTALRRKFSS